MSKYYEAWKLDVRPDEDPPHPRHDWEPVSTMVCWHKRYNLGDEHSFENPDDFREKITEENHVICPLFMFDHGTIAVSITPFSCPWDSGQVGFVYVSKDAPDAPNLRDWRSWAMTMIRAEVEEYSAFLSGEVFGYTLYQGLNNQGEPFLRPRPPSSDQWPEIEWEYVESSWGFNGHDSARDAIIDEMPTAIRHALEEESHIDMYGDTVVWVSAENPPVEEKKVTPVRLRGGELPEEDE